MLKMIQTVRRHGSYAYTVERTSFRRYRAHLKAYVSFQERHFFDTYWREYSEQYIKFFRNGKKFPYV